MPMTQTPPYTSTPIRDIKRHAIMRETLTLASFDGWNQATLVKAAVHAGYAPLTARQVFPSGVPEVLECFADWVAVQLEDEAAKAGLASMRVHERVIWLVWKRLELVEPHHEAVRRAVALSVQPSVAWQYTQNVWQVCDQIWRLAGDTSLDFNYYTKRSLLAKVYGATLLYWLNDESVDYIETRAFLERRIADVLRVGGALGKNQARITNMVEHTTDQWLNRKRYRTKRRG